MNTTFSPVFVAAVSVIIRSAGTPMPRATSAKTSASGRSQSSFVSVPRFPEKTIQGAQPSRKSSAPRSATRVSWLPRTRMASARSSVWWARW